MQCAWLYDGYDEGGGAWVANGVIHLAYIIGYDPCYSTKSCKVATGAYHDGKPSDGANTFQGPMAATDNRCPILR